MFVRFFINNIKSHNPLKVTLESIYNKFERNSSKIKKMFEKIGVIF